MVQLGRGVFWEQGDTGSVEFGAATDPGFEVFADLATNGMDDVFGDGVFWPTGGVISRSLESEVFQGSPDLVGFELDFVRLSVRQVDFTPFESPTGVPGVTVDYDLTYDFFGHPIPEPSSIILVGPGAVGLMIRVAV